ncbi:molybdopterin molybdotransferase MoeA [bacterium]|nr:molybdopterin molybdotransferase MoeA [bacterium]
MLTYEEALGKILGIDWEIGTERVALLEAGGRHMAASVQAPWPLPRYTNSAMDGFTVRCSDIEGATPDTPVDLPIAGESAAGHPLDGPIEPGTAVRISTGAQIPDGADGVVPTELVDVKGERVVFRQPATPGRYIRRQGEDVAEGANLFGRGKRLDPATLAFLAMYNIPEVEVLRHPRVAIMTSGDEVKHHGAELGETDIVGVNIYYLEQELRAFGCEPRIIGIAPDEPAKFRAMFEEAVDWGDVIVSTAGVSVGEHDIVHEVLRDMKADILMWRSAVRPGKPLLVATIGKKPYFGMPGNPVSVCANTEIYLKPFLRQAMGIAPICTPLERMELLVDCPRDRGRLFFVYARAAVVNGNWKVEPLGHQSSGNLSNAAHGNCLIVLEPGDEKVSAGEMVDVMRIAVGK